jgi:hypothetical protein
MNRAAITGGDLQRILARDFAQYPSIKEACEHACKEYGLTAETMRCYASGGVPMRSRAYSKIKKRLTEIEQEETTAMVTVTVANKKLVESITDQIRAYETAADSLRKIRDLISR